MSNSLRLTLRTLLSYLDDTLDPGQAKLIGQKVAESDQARELMDRIKQVTRRRRLTTPPAAGPGGIDANTIAEYLDNEVTSEQAEEVERICLASDVHLAEVAACHQILTLVLGEPALVPPSSRQRMYGLVKGPEAIPFRKPPKAAAKSDLDLSTSDAGHELDESMQMPRFMRNTGMRNTLLLAGGGVLAACLLVVALWQLFKTSGNPEVEQPGKDQIVLGDGKGGDKSQEKEKPRDEQKKPDEINTPDKKSPEAKKPEGGSATEVKTPIAEKKTPESKAVTEIVDGREEVPLAAPKLTPVVLGQFEPNFKTADATFQKEAGAKGNWMRLWGKNIDVASARPIMTLPGNHGEIKLNTGIQLTLWGSTPEIWPDQNTFESMITLYADPVLAADMTLQRGRVLLKNLRADGKPAMVRVRYDNPLQKKQEAFTIALLDNEATAVVEHSAAFPHDEPFYDDKDNVNRMGPTAAVYVVLLDGTAYVRWGGSLDLVDARAKPQVLYWISALGMTARTGGGDHASLVAA